MDSAHPATFDEFLAAMADAHAAGGLTVDEGIYEQFFEGVGEGNGARPEFIAALPRPPSSTTTSSTESCPVCLQSLAAILTEEEYALASEHYFGDAAALGVRQLPCPGKHVVCARCVGAWLRINNTCPMCRAPMDADAPVPVDTIENQRATERFLALFRYLQHGGPAAAGGASAAGGGSGGARAGAGGGAGAAEREREREKEDRSAFAGMYS